MMKPCVSSAVSFCILISAALPATAANTVSGFFRMANVRDTFTSACAYRIPDDDAPGARVTLLFAANKPLDCAAADAGYDPQTALIQQVLTTKGAFVTVRIGKELGQARCEYSTPSIDGGYPFGFDSLNSLTLGVNKDSRVEGIWHSTAPEKFFNKTYEYDLKFAVDVSGGPFMGKAIGAGGGAPGKVYQAFIAAVAKSDSAAIRKVVASESAERYTDETAMKMVHKLMLKNAKVQGGLEKGGHAVLNVMGTNHGGEKMAGRVQMRQDNGAWKVVDEQLRVQY